MGRTKSCQNESNKCIRCKGFVVFDKFYNFCKWVSGLRCVNCGWTKLLDGDYDKVKIFVGKPC